MAGTCVCKKCKRTVSIYYIDSSTMLCRDCSGKGKGTWVPNNGPK